MAYLGAKMELKQSVLTLGMLVALAGCIESSSDDDTEGGGANGDGADRISFTGLVADGYLDGATVCLDLNENKECDADEPSATSGAGGIFEIADATQEQRDSYPLLVVIEEGVTIDEDTKTSTNPDGTPFDKPLTLSAPAGYENVTPLSTMVQNEVESGASEAEAEAAVQEKLGTTLELDSDYIAGAQAGGVNAEEYEKLQQVAQVTARVISENIEELESAIVGTDVTLEQLISTIVNEVFDALDEITIQVVEIANDPDTEFDPDTVAQAVDEELVDLDPDNIEDQVAFDDLEDNALEVSLADAVKADGIYWFWSEREDGDTYLEYGSVGIEVKEGGDEFYDVEYEWDSATSAFTSKTPDGETDSGYVLDSTNGWTAISDVDSLTNLTTNEDGSINLIKAEGTITQRLSGKAFDLVGINVRATLSTVDDGDNFWADYLPADLEFPANSLGYELIDAGSDEPYLFEDWSGCEVEQQVGGLCNYAYVQDGSGDNTGAVATLADITVASAATVVGSAATDLPGLKAVEVAYGETNKVWAEIVTDGVVNYYLIGHGHDSISLMGSATWESITIGGETIYEIEPIPSLRNFDSELEGNETFVLAEIEGFVRIAHHELADSGSNGIGLLNKVATEFVIANFNVDNLPLASIAPCEDGNTEWDGLGESIETQWSSSAQYEAAISSCLATLATTEVPFVDSNIIDGVSDHLVSGSRTTFLANGKGLMTPSEVWFDWFINEDNRLVMEYLNESNNLITITSAQLLRSESQGYVQNKTFVENSGVTLAYGDLGVISSNAFEISLLDPANIDLPTILFDDSTMAGVYIGVATNGDGEGAFTFNANGTGIVHWTADAEDLAEDPNHPGYDDGLSWSVDDQGRLLLNLFSLSDNEFFGVDRYSLTAGDQTSGSITAEEINSNGRYQSLGSFTWTRTGDAPVALCATGDIEWDQTADPSGATLKTRANYDAAVAACLGSDISLPLRSSEVVNTTFIAVDEAGDPEFSYTFDGYDSVEGANTGSILTPDGTFTFTWGIEQEQDIDPNEGEDITGVLKLNYLDAEFEQITMLSFDSDSNTAALKGRTQFESAFPGQDKGDIWSGLYVKTSPAGTTLTSLASVGVIDESRTDGTRVTYWDFIDNGNNEGVFKIYEREDPAVCFDLTEIPLTDNGSGSFSLDGSGFGEPSVIPAVWYLAADNRVYDDNDSFPLASDQNILTSLTMCTP